MSQPPAATPGPQAGPVRSAEPAAVPESPATPGSRAGSEPPQAPRLAEVLRVLEAWYPPATAAAWDRVGLVTGDPDQRVRAVLFAVDPTLEIVEDAIAGEFDLVVTHHPLLLRGVHAVATTTAKGKAITRLIRSGVALFTAHTNADVADPGVCDALASAFGLTDVVPLQHEEGEPYGRLGRLSETMSLRDFAARVATALPSAPVGIRVSGPPSAPVTTVAVLGGAGDGFFGAVRSAGADVYVTADLRHHPALEAREDSGGGPPYLIDAGHWATEWLWLEGAARRLRQQFPGQSPVRTAVSTRCTDPWTFVLGAVAADDGAQAAIRRTDTIRTIQESESR